MDPNAITYFAETDARNKKIKFGIKAKDRLKHVYVIGKTGMGKSTLLENMAIQDIQNGNGIAFIDPHGGTAEKLLEYVPEHRIKDVLYFAPFDMEYPISFNVMEDIGQDKRHLVVNGLMSTFEKIWVDAWSARMAYILNNTLLALLEYPGSTLLGVNRMLSDKEYRKKVVENIKDTSVRAFWVDEFGKWTEKFIAEAIPAIQNKVGQFTSNPLVRNLLGQPKSSFDIRKMMDEKKILIVNLSKGRVGEGNANLIGSMLITKIYLAAMSRADKNEHELAKLPNFYLYVDEFQSFANKSFADILSEARKYKLNLTIAHQYIEQMEEEVRDAVFGNVGTMISFRVGAFDAEVLEKEFAPTFEAADLVNLGFAQIYLKLMIDGVSSQPFSATTMGPIAKPDISFKDKVIESSREQFAHPRSEVEKGIVDWHDSGTGREVRVQQNQNEQIQNSDNRSGSDRNSQPSQNNRENHREEQKVDENKIAFMKAAEELKQKTKEIEKTIPIVDKKTETVSLSSLNKDKKNPTKENLNSLKNALADVIGKVKPTEKVSIEDKKNEQPKEKPQPIKEHIPKNEVPEDILRQLLSMDGK
ncbi:MAG: hypothetical protein AB201_03600 [Parcubacteria bacterium C7867-006]|nr:MAG: hypothetical protein AB201_03600 [Parcubacteria bacterium C7867-006]